MNSFINLNKFLKNSPLLNPLKEYYPSYLIQLLELSVNQWEKNNNKNALKYCDEFNSQSENTIIGYLLAFVIELPKYSNKTALKKLEKIILKNEHLTLEKKLYHFIKASLLFKNWDINEAKAEYDLVINLDKNEYLAYIMRGQCYALRDKHNLAILDFKKGLKENYKTDEIKANLAYSYLRNGNIWKSLKIHKTIVDKLPNNFKVQYNMGICYKRFRRYKKSIKYFNRAIELDKTNANFYLTRARVFMRLKKHNKAKKDLIFATEHNIELSKELLEINEEVITKEITIKQSERKIRELLNKAGNNV